MVTTMMKHPSVDERRAEGKEARERTPLAAHAGWTATSDRPDPVALLEAQNAHPRAGPGARPPRSHGGVAVHLLPGCRKDHGGRSQGHADGRPERPAVR